MIKFQETWIPGLFVVQLEPHCDSRGTFCELYSFMAFPTKEDISLVNISVSRKAGTLRGLHYQEAPFAQEKFVVCMRGRVRDIAVDLRPESPTYSRHFAMDLHENSSEGMFIPRGMAHGWQALSDEAEILYVVFGAGYKPASERGLRYDDPKLGIEWPLAPTVVSDRDRSWQLLG